MGDGFFACIVVLFYAQSSFSLLSRKQRKQLPTLLARLIRHAGVGCFFTFFVNIVFLKFQGIFGKL